ncbi:MAG: peptide-methionine (R)-S-oxide reductase MsrB [Pirellulaceae bacterium]|nr:peptide-methionine (R)-S-oxide reductase MsrB [Pirellulaceae bacterium]
MPDPNVPLLRTEEEWKNRLTAAQYAVARGKGTEPPFSGEYHDCKRPGIYRCVCCGRPLFSSETKYDSGTGWPSFFRPIDPSHLAMADDDSLGYRRVEVLCRRCGAHLGHVFDDGPEPTGLRYCINSTCLTLDETALGDPRAKRE